MWNGRRARASPSIVTAAATAEVPSLWQDKEWFCLRSAGDLRLVEVSPAGATQPFVLHTKWYGCTEPAQQFSYRGHSIWSKGAGSYVNMRQLQHLRAHGDTMPWMPLLRETRTTRLVIDEAPEAKDPITYERRVLGLLSSLEQQAQQRT